MEKKNYLLRGKQYSCPFSFVLPASSLSSVEGSHGRVRFTLKAKRTPKSSISVWPDWKTESTNNAFPVVKLADLNVNPHANVYSVFKMCLFMIIMLTKNQQFCQ